MHLGPDVWGPHLWKSLHMITLGYPNDATDEQRKNYKSFFEKFHLVIPCSICANNYKQHLIDIPLTNDILKNKDSLIRWLIDIHNLVNKETGKPILTHDEAIALMKNNFIPTNSQYKSTTQPEPIASSMSTTTALPISSTPTLPINISVQNNENKKDHDENKFYPLWILVVILVLLVMIAIAYKKSN
jgi:hypothetical protein